MSSGVRCNLSQEDQERILAGFDDYLTREEEERVEALFHPHLFYSSVSRSKKACYCESCKTSFEVTKATAPVLWREDHGSVAKCPRCGEAVEIICEGRIRTGECLEESKCVLVIRADQDGALRLYAGVAKRGYERQDYFDDWNNILHRELQPFMSFLVYRRYYLAPWGRQCWKRGYYWAMFGEYRPYYHTKELVQGRANKGVVKGHTNNPKGRDGLRSGKVVFNEVHAFENYDNIKVFITGQGKVAQPRVGIFTSNGDVSDGPLDDYLARGRRILFEGEPDNGFLPFICCLKSKDQVHDPENWYMANPSLFYLPHLLQEIQDEYQEWLEHPEQNGDFLNKRMGIRSGFKEISVTDYEKVRATNKPLPDLTGWSCTVGLDYAELSDWAAINLHFRRGNDRFDINHAWICRQSKTLPRVKAPWQTWAEDGKITVVDDVSISADLLAEYIWKAGQKYNIRKFAMDNYRWALVAEAMKKIGFDAADKNRVHLVRPSDIMRVEPIIQECFDRGYFSWGDTPHLRWAVNNTKRVRSSKKMGVDTGNFIYAKIEAKSRKTDPWMALVASMTVEDELGTGLPVAAPPIGAIAL